jgi:hypothetical protein
MVRQEGSGEDWYQVGLNGMRWLLKRWWFWGGAGFMLVAVCVGYLVIPLEKSRITQENSDKIQRGWTREQVESVLGWRGLDEHTIGAWWEDEDGNKIAVGFELGGGVTSGATFEPSNLSVYERIKRRIERRVQALWP